MIERTGVDVSRFPFARSFHGPTVAAIGNFDGLHIGHAALLKEVKSAAENTHRPILISFYPHPSQVLGIVKHMPRITSLRQRVEILNKLGIQELVLLHFTHHMSKWSAADFTDRILKRFLNVDRLVVGPDAAIGSKREGTVDWMTDNFSKFGIQLTIKPFLESSGTRVSSRRIRAVIIAGEVEDAAKLLGRPYELESRVTRGDGRGSAIGIPTANLPVTHGVIPKRGVYAGWCTLRGEKFKAVANIGIRPTFGGEREWLEVHLINYQGTPFYGERISMSFQSRLRDEQRFGSVDELVKQIKSDIGTAQRTL